jgi:hypothetical protein
MNVRWPIVVAAALLVLVGGIFALQGAGFLPSEVMHGKLEWLVIGVVMVAVGLFLGYRGLGRQPQA